MFSLVELLRPANCAMAGLGVLVGGFLVIETLTIPLLMAALAAALITGAGNAINDYFDVETDKINRPKRPIPGGRISRKQALAFSAVLFTSGILIALQLNWVCLGLAILNSLVLVAYSFSMQGKILIGNVAVAYLVGSTFLFGGAAAGDLLLPLMLAALAALATLSREIVKDLEDIDGDAKSFVIKAAAKIKSSFADRFRISKGGIKLRYRTIYAVLIASFSIWLAVLASLLPYMWGILGLSYLIVLVPTDAVFIYSSFALISRRNYSLVSRMLKIGMLLGLLAFFSGTLF
jgi:geranylgeranylglycerol-phosphate geranylgeranyltransferase